MHQSWTSWIGVSRSAGVSRDGLSRLSIRVEEMGVWKGVRTV